MKINDIFTKDLPDVLSNYEKRNVQEEMAEEIYKSLEKDSNLIIEAGTGVGKSLGYLIPAVLWSLENSEPVVVATYTKNLQDQLIKKDIPILRKVLSKNNIAFSAVVVKGRKNYVCLRRLEEYRNHLEMDDEGKGQQTFDSEIEKEKEQLAQLLEELQASHDGQRDNFQTSTYKIWKKICGESDLCLKGHCPWRKKCYINNARIYAKEANIILVNHALFFSNIAIKIAGGNEILPSYTKVILDEAHHIEDVACENMAITVDEKKIKNYYFSLAAGNQEISVQIRSDESYYEKLKKIGEKLNKALQEMSDELENFLGNDKVLRIKKPFLTNTRIVSVFEEIVNLISSENFSKSLNLSDEGIAELENFVNSGKDILSNLNFLINVKELDSYVYWCEKNLIRNEIVLKSVPIMVDNILKEYLFKNTTAVLTSATLSTNDNFDYISERVGITNYKGIKLESPFDYQNNCLLYVPQKTVSPKSKNYYDFVIEKCMELLEITRGNSFVLFTSYKAMNYCYDMLEEWLLDKGYQPFVQNYEENYNTILQNYKASKNPVLFATNSFWEGVDVPGEKLSCVIITKLPFNVPTKPIEMARVEKIKSKGCNDFLHYSVPKAAIRLKQGFGRLIRNTEDRGVVAILDSRIIKTGYGKYFLDSLPKTLRNKSLKAVERIFV